jgi:hypothetical protein
MSSDGCADVLADTPPTTAVLTTLLSTVPRSRANDARDGNCRWGLAAMWIQPIHLFKDAAREPENDRNNVWLSLYGVLD